MKYGLDDSTIALIHGVLIRYDQVEKAVIYGSRAKGNFKTGSDIDLTLYGGHELDLRVLSLVMDDIDDLLLPYSFDISIMHTITDQELLDHIQRAGELFYEKSLKTAIA
jgi:predicted nucleotidyltransferase